MASLYGKGNYGVGLYSQSSVHSFVGNLAPTVSFSGAISIPGQQYLHGNLAPSITFHATLTATEVFSGNLAPSVSFAANLSISHGRALAGNLAPGVTLSAHLTRTVALNGGVAPQVIFSGALTRLLLLEGNLPIAVSLGPSSITAGPLWTPQQPGTPPWGPSAPCPPSMWTPVGPCAPVGWEETEPCDG